jgi:hypothetical protein
VNFKNDKNIEDKDANEEAKLELADAAKKDSSEEKQEGHTCSRGHVQLISTPPMSPRLVQ